MPGVSFIPTLSHLPYEPFVLSSVSLISSPSHLPYHLPPPQITQRSLPQMVLSESPVFRKWAACYAGRKIIEDEDKGKITGIMGVMEEIRSSRRFKQNGISCGVISLVLAISVGVAFDIFESSVVLLIAATGLAYFVRNTLEYNKLSQPLPDTFFEVRQSLIPNAGNGLFTLQVIPEGTYLMDYEGEVLSEIEYFQRYPTGQGRYVAEIPEAIPLPGFGRWNEPTYIDGTNPSRSNLARYMNSKSIKEGANVFWKKQRFGLRSMHFYTTRDLKEGDELYFDYGANYWDAIVEQNGD